MALCVVVGVVRGAVAWLLPGYLTGDDVEMVESMLARVGALAYEPWEIRSQFLPVALAPAVRFLRWLGLSSPALASWACELPFVLAGALTVGLTYRLGRAWSLPQATSWLAALLLAVHPLAFAYGSMALPRVAGTAAVVAAAWLGSRPGAAPLQGGRVGLLLALAVACRYSEVIFALPILLLLWRSRGCARVVAALSALAGFGVGLALLVGVVDWLAWGRPFASLAAFFDYTLVERAASAAIREQPATWYLRRVFFWVPATLVPFFVFGWREAAGRAAGLFIVLPVLLLSFIHHKDLRYVQGVLPFLALFAAIGAWELWQRGRWARALTVALAMGAVGLGLAGAGRILARTSTAAVLAARELAADPAVETVAVSQAWAYGHSIYFGDRVGLRDLPVAPTVGELAAGLAGADAAALYAETLAERRELRAVLAASGFRETRTVRAGRSPSVSLWRAEPSRGVGAG